MDEKELEALFELLQESESGLEDVNEARAIIETEGIGVFFPLVEDSFESTEQFQQAFPSLKKKDDSQFSSEEEVMVSDTEQVQEPGSSEPSPQIPSEPAGSSLTTPPIQPEVVETTAEEVVTETPVEEDLMETDTEELYQSDGLITDEYTSPGLIEATDEDVDNLPGILGLFDYNEWMDFGDDVVKTVGNAVDRGNTVDEALKLLYEGADAKDIDIENFLKVLQDLENGEYVREEEEWNKAKEKWGGGAFGWLMAYYENPTRAPLALIQSVTQLANKASLSAGGTVVAGTTAAGAAAAGAGAVPAFVASLPWAYGAASATLETGLTFAELLEEQVKENGDEWNLEGVKKVLSNPEQLQDLRIKSAGRGAVIGLVDKYTGGITSSMVKKAAKDVSKQTLKEGLKTAVKVEAVGSVGGGVGEVLGMTVAGQEYDVAEILDEMFIGTQGTAVEAGSAITLNKIRPAVYKLNSKGKDGIVSEQDMITFLKTATDAEIAEAEVTIENNSALKKIAEDRKNKAQKDAIVKAELKRLGINNEQDLNELTSLEHEKSRLEKDNTRASKRRLVEVNNRIDEILDNTKVETTAEVEVTDQEARESLELDNELNAQMESRGMPNSGQQIIDDAAIQERKNKLIKEKQDAIQESSTTQVDVQESTQDSQEVGERDTPGQPTQEGQENQTDIETQQETEIETPAFEQVDETVSMNRSKIPPNKTRFAFSELVKETAVKAGKALKNIVPEIKIVLHENANDFADQANDNANNRGVYDNNTKTIHINLEKAKRSTIAHETFHAIILSKLKTDVNTQQVTKKMMQSLAKTLPKDSALLKKVNEFAANYDANLQNEEKVAEIVGELSSNYQQLSAPQKSLIRRWINKIAQTLGIKKELDSATQTDQDVIDLLNTLSKKVRTGETITEQDVSVLDEGRVQKPVKETKKTSKPKQRQQKGQPTTMAKLMNFYKMDKDGFIEPKNVYDLDALEEWAGKVGHRVDRSRGDRGETTKYYLRDKQTDRKFNPVTKRQQKGEMTGYERMMKEVEGIISKSEKRGVKFNKISENVIEYIKGSKVYERATDIQRENLLRDARERFGIKDKPSVTMNKLFDKLKDVKKITVSDKTLLYQRLRDLNRGAKTAKAAFVKGSKELAATTKELVSSGRISAKQAAAVISRFSKVNMFNDASVNSFIDYMANVFKDAEYSSKMAFANKKRKQAKKNIFTKLGKADGLLGSLNRLLSVNPTLIPDSVLNKYLEVLEMFGERASVLTLDEKSKSIKDVESILEALEMEQSKVDELSLIFADSNNKVYNDNDTINYTETVKKMLDEGEITTEYADLMRKYKKDISPQLEDTQQTDAELDQERQDIIKRFDNVIIDKDSLPTREERALAKRLDKLINTVALDQLNITQLKNLLKVIDNINNGYLPHYAQLLVESMEAINDGDTLADGISKGKPLPLSKIYANFKSLLTRKDAYLEMIRRNPLFYIDQVFGNFKGKDIYNSLFNPLAKAKATFDKAFSTVQQRIERAQDKVKKSFKSDMNKLLKSSFKQTAYMVQLEFESNPDSKQVNPAAEYIKSTIKAIRDGKTHYAEKDAQVLEDILEDFSDSKGNINLDKLYNSFNPAEKNSIKVIQDVNKEMLPLAEYTSGVIRGDKINPIDNYVHLNVIQDTTETIKGTDSVTEFSDSLNPSTKAKSLISRTGKVAPLNFNIYSSAQRGAKFVLLDRYMTEPVRTARRTLKFAENKLEQDNNGRIPKEQRKIFNAIKGAFNESIEMDLVNMFTESTLGDRAFDYMSKQGYRTMLAGTGRFAAELLANLSYAVFVNPQALLTAGKLRSFVMSADAVQVMDNVNSTQTNRMFPGDKLSGRMVDTNILNQSIGKKDSKTKSIVANKLQQIYNLSLKKYMNFVELTADTLISSPDKMIMKPIWFGSFANAFKEAAGVEVDLDKIAKNDEAYMTKYAEAIKTAQVKADENSVQAGATTNPYQTFLKGKTNKNQSISARAFNIFNNFMQNFLIFEYMTARTGINAAVGNGMINKIQGAKMIAGVTSRMVLYTLLVKVMGSGLIGLFSDEEEEEKKDIDKQVGQAVLSAFSTLLLGRDFGNVTKSLINIGVENFNEQNLEMLRDGEYDPYKDALQYTITAGRREYKGYDLGKIMLNLFGPYTPAIKTLSFGVSKLGEPKRKTKAARERQEREISERLPLEILGNLGLIPIYKDVRKEVIGTIYKDINKKPSTPMSDKDMKKYHPELYRMQKDLEKRTPQAPNIPTPPTPKLPR